MKRTNPVMPRAREEELVVEKLPDETLVYDLKSHKASCLNRTAALVWSDCDGQTSVAEMATMLERELETPVDEAVVWMALDRLSKVHLLSDPVTLPADRAQYSRREMLRKLRRVAGIALVLPVIESIIAPLAAAQASCLTNCSGQPNCTPCRTSGQCNKLCCNGSCMNSGQAKGQCGC